MAVFLLVRMILYHSQSRDNPALEKIDFIRRYKDLFSLQHLYNLMRILILMKIVLTIYCTIKQAIPRINQRLYDEELLMIDTIVHAGINPMVFSVNLFSEFWFKIIDFIYISWYAIKIVVLALFAVIADKNLQSRFFGAFFCLWIIGGLLAVAFPSLGPVYFTPEWFVNVTRPHALKLQMKLWLSYQDALANPELYKILIYEGIAAFPSLHVAIVALFTFFLFRVNRIAGVLMGAYTIIIQIGSVVLGWHYAIDGYFGILLAYLLYALSGKIFLLERDKSKKADAG
jgi:hypothetical protein